MDWSLDNIYKNILMNLFLDIITDNTQIVKGLLML